MDIDRAHYHGWDGQLRTPWAACGAIVRVGMLQVFRTKAYWFVLALGLLRFLAFWSIIYAVTQLALPEPTQRRLLQQFGFSAADDGAQESGYIAFINGQNVIVMILLAFAGSQIVGADFRNKALPFYLSRRIDRRHYIVGKLLSVSAVVAMLTVVPSLLLFLEYGMLTSSTTYWAENWRIVVSVLGFGAVLCFVNSVLLVTLAAYLQRVVPITIVWATLFVLVGRLGDYLYRETENESWRLLDIWRDMRLVGQLCFDRFRSESDRQLAWWALAILGGLCAVSLAALVHRVRAVDIVE